VARFAEGLADDYFLELSKDTLDRYTDTSLQTSDDYEYFLLRRAVMLDAGCGCHLEIFAGGSAEPKPEGALLHFCLRTADTDAACAPKT